MALLAAMIIFKAALWLFLLTCPPKTDPGRIIGMEDRGKGAGDAQEEAQS